MPNLATTKGQQWLERDLHGVELLVLDNLATLFGRQQENTAESWLPIQKWLLSLRRRGISVLIVHHAGKNGEQRDSSSKEDILDCSIRLRRPDDYMPEDGARFIVELTKARGIRGPDAAPFEAVLSTIDGKTEWTTKDMTKDLLSDVVRLMKEGVSTRKAADELGVHERGTPMHLSEEQKIMIRQSMERVYSGSGNAGKLLLPGPEFDLKLAHVTPEDTELLDSRKHITEEICRLFQVPPPIIQDYSHNTFTNSEQAGRWFSQFCLLPWVRKLEASFNLALVGDEMSVPQSHFNTLVTHEPLQLYQRYFSALCEPGRESMPQGMECDLETRIVCLVQAQGINCTIERVRDIYDPAPASLLKKQSVLACTVADENGQRIRRQKYRFPFAALGGDDCKAVFFVDVASLDAENFRCPHAGMQGNESHVVKLRTALFQFIQQYGCLFRGKKPFPLVIFLRHGKVSLSREWIDTRVPLALDGEIHGGAHKGKSFFCGSIGHLPQKNCFQGVKALRRDGGYRKDTYNRVNVLVIPVLVCRGVLAFSLAPFHVCRNDSVNSSTFLFGEQIRIFPQVQLVYYVYAPSVGVFFFDAMTCASYPRPARLAVIPLNPINFIRFSLIFHYLGLRIVYALIFLGANLFRHRENTYQEGSTMTRRYPYGIPKEKRPVGINHKSLNLLARDARFELTAFGSGGQRSIQLS